MFSSIAQTAQGLLRYVAECRFLMDWVDVLDIAFVGALLSFSLVWLHGRTARAILFALVPLLGAFAAARSLKMYMTSVIFQAGLTALFVIIIVIFQDDFRRAFEGLAVWRPWGRQRKLNAAKLAELFCDALGTLAERKVGALIVVQGRQPISMHLRAGIPLNGTISIPLLLSIFDPNSPGHDGGVIISDGRIAAFGAHLPLSRNSESTGRLGTRHAAALGLAEKSDSLVLVVSEETGEISLARDAKIAVAKSTAEIIGAIENQFRRVGPTSIHRSLWEVPWLRLSISYSMALALWIVFARPVNPILRTVEASIVYRGLPEGWEVKPPEPSKVKVTLFGPEGPLMAIDESTFAVSVDLLRVAEGQQRFTLSEPDVSLPSHVRAQRFEPPEIYAQAYLTSEKVLPVETTWLEAGGRAPASGTVSIAPAMVRVRFPRLMALPPTLQTEPVDLRELKRSGKIKAKLRAPADSPDARLSTSEVEISLVQ